MWTLIFGRMVVYKKKNQKKEDHIFLSNGRVQIKHRNQWGT